MEGHQGEGTGDGEGKGREAGGGRGERNGTVGAKGGGGGEASKRESGEREEVGGDARERMTHLTYSLLFSSVTLMSLPPGFSSYSCTFPKELCSTEKVLSRTFSMLFSL